MGRKGAVRIWSLFAVGGGEQGGPYLVNRPGDFSGGSGAPGRTAGGVPAVHGVRGRRLWDLSSVMKVSVSRLPGAGPGDSRVLGGSALRQIRDFRN